MTIVQSGPNLYIVSDGVYCIVNDTKDVTLFPFQFQGTAVVVDVFAYVLFFIVNVFGEPPLLSPYWTKCFFNLFSGDFSVAPNVLSEYDVPICEAMYLSCFLNQIYLYCSPSKEKSRTNRLSNN